MPPQATIQAAQEMRQRDTDKWELPLIPSVADPSSHMILVIGGTGAGKTTLVRSMEAVIAGTYPTSKVISEGRNIGVAPVFTKGRAEPKDLPIRITDTEGCGVNEEAGEHPMSHATFPPTGVTGRAPMKNMSVPAWLRVPLVQHQACVICIDSMAAPLWEDQDRAASIARLVSMLIRSEYNIVLGVTKLQLRHRDALRKERDTPCYDTFAWQYLDKTRAALQFVARKNRYPLQKEVHIAPEKQPKISEYVRVNETIFDACAWEDHGKHREWQVKHKTWNHPVQIQRKLQRLVDAVLVRNPPDFEPRPHVSSPIPV